MKANLSLLLLPLWPVMWLQRQLAREVKLKKVDGRRRLVLDAQPARGKAAAAKGKPTKAGPAKGKPAATGTTPAQAVAPVAAKPVPAPAVTPDAVPIPSEMQTELRQLLDQHQQARNMMRHLGYVERTLGLMGPDALAQLPLDVIRKASDQLEQLVTDWSTPGLAELRLRLAMALSDLEEQAAAKAP